LASKGEKDITDGGLGGTHLWRGKGDEEMKRLAESVYIRGKMDQEDVGGRSEKWYFKTEMGGIVTKGGG